MSDTHVLEILVEELKRRQSWCPVCGGEHVHQPNCVLNGRWFEDEQEEST